MRRYWKWIFYPFLLVIPIIAAIFITWIYTTSANAETLSAISGLAVATATLELAILALFQIIDSKEKAIQASRPILLPNEMINYDERFWDASEFKITILNTGLGPALDIWGVILPPEYPEPTTDLQYSFFANLPISPDDKHQVKFDKGGTLFLPKDKIAGIKMGVPRGREPEKGIPNFMNRRPRCVLRMTISYRDVYGRKYASIFDLTQLHEWISVSIKQDILHDIADLDELKGTKSKK
jgi:hypothetical protein